MIPANARVARFRANVRGWFAHHDFPEPVLFDIGDEPECDRCYIEWTPDMEACIGGSVGTLLDHWTLRIKAHKPLGIETAADGWRERVATYSVQIIKHIFEGRIFFEIDWDPRNPNWGLGLLIGHGVDFLLWVFRGWKVDPFKVAEVLRKRGIIDG